MEKATKSTRAKLPKLTIPKFKGTSTDWIRFKSMFTSQIESQPISNVDKFSYLMELIGEKPMEIIGNIPMNDDGYIIAWELLQEEYGREQSVIAAHTSEILKLPVIYGTKYSKVRDFHDQLTRNYEALKAIKSETKFEGIVIETLDKLVHIKADLVRNDNNWEQWTFEKLVKELRELLKRHKPRELACQSRSEEKSRSSFSSRELQSGSKTFYTPEKRGEELTKFHGKKKKLNVCFVVKHIHHQTVMK